MTIARRSFVLLVVAAAVVAAASVPGRGMAQEPPAESVWVAAARLEGETLTLRLGTATGGDPTDGGTLGFFDIGYSEFFDVEWLIAPEQMVSAIVIEYSEAGIAHEGVTYEILALCPDACLTAGEETVIIIAADGFPFVSVEEMQGLADAGELSVVAQTSDGDVAGTLGFVGQDPGGEVVATTEVPAGLSLLSWCGAPTSSEELFRLLPYLESVFVFDGASGGFRGAHRDLPASLREDIPIEFLSAFFVRAELPFLLEVRSVAAPGDEPDGLVLNLSLGWDRVLAAGLHMIGNCGDPQTNAQIMDANPSVQRLFVFDDVNQRWIASGRTASGIVIQNEGWLVAPSAGLAVAADAPMTVTMPCTTATCRAVFEGLVAAQGSG